MSKKALMMMSSALAFPLSGASIDLWFANNLIYPSGGFTDYLSCSRASIGYAKNADGTLTQFASMNYASVSGRDCWWRMRGRIFVSSHKILSNWSVKTNL